MRDVVRKIMRAIPSSAPAWVLLFACTVAWCLPLGASAQREPKQDTDRFGELVFAAPEEFEYLVDSDRRP